MFLSAEIPFKSDGLELSSLSTPLGTHLTLLIYCILATWQSWDFQMVVIFNCWLLGFYSKWPRGERPCCIQRFVKGLRSPLQLPNYGTTWITSKRETESL